MGSLCGHYLYLKIFRIVPFLYLYLLTGSTAFCRAPSADHLCPPLPSPSRLLQVSMLTVPHERWSITAVKSTGVTLQLYFPILALLLIDVLTLNKLIELCL